MDKETQSRIVESFFSTKRQARYRARLVHRVRHCYAECQHDQREQRAVFVPRSRDADIFKVRGSIPLRYHLKNKLLPLYGKASLWESVSESVPFLPQHDIVVIGTSAGGLEALQVLVAGLPVGLKAAVFIVLHIGIGLRGVRGWGKDQRSKLPEILSRAGALPAVHPSDGEAIRVGRIYVAPPDYHLSLLTGHMHLSQGPKEHGTRPAINPLFRSAAVAYGVRTIGVILTGLLDDGVDGLVEIKRRGGLVIAQHPDTALFPSMPYHAIHRVDVDYVTPLNEIAALVSELTIRSTSQTLQPSLDEVT